MGVNKKTICVLRSNPVNPDSRVEKECTALCDSGYIVHIFCWDRESNHGPARTTLADNRVKITRVGFKASYGEGLKNIKAYLQFQFAMRKWLRQHDSEFDAIHACDFDTAFFSLSVAKHLKKKYVFDIFDFICGDPKNLFQRCVKNAQFRIIKKADATIICSEDRINQIRGSKPKNLVIIHNSPPVVNYECKFNQSDTVSVAYIGILSDNRLLIEEANAFARHKEWVFNVGGFGLHEKDFIRLSKEYANIKYLGKLPYNETLRVESQSDILIAIYDPQIENHRYAAPNKFYEALMLGKPLLMVRETGMSDLVEKYDIGAVIDYSEDGFEKGLINLINRKDEWREMSKRMKELYRSYYSWDVMRKRLVDLYNELLA